MSGPSLSYMQVQAGRARADHHVAAGEGGAWLLDRQAEIAPGFYVGHFGSIYVGPGVRIGCDGNISQMCFIAAAEDGSGAPIGANAVVDDVPPNGVVAGVPAQLISQKGSGDFILVEGSSAPLH